MAILVLAETLTVFFAWKTADAPDGFSDTNHILLTLALQIQAWIVGVPILVVLGSSSADATYLGRVFLVWIFSVSSVALVVWPRIILAIRLRRNPDLGRKSRVRISGIVQKPEEAQPITPNGAGLSSYPSKRELIKSSLQRASERASAAVGGQPDGESVSPQTSGTGSMTSGDLVSQSLDFKPTVSSKVAVPKIPSDIQEDHNEINPSIVHDVEMPNIVEGTEPVGEEVQT